MVIMIPIVASAAIEYKWVHLACITDQGASCEMTGTMSVSDGAWDDGSISATDVLFLSITIDTSGSTYPTTPILELDELGISEIRHFETDCTTEASSLLRHGPVPQLLVFTLRHQAAAWIASPSTTEARPEMSCADTGAGRSAMPATAKARSQKIMGHR